MASRSYPFDSEADKRRFFKTDREAEYTAYFLDGSGYFPGSPEYEGKVFMFGFGTNSSIFDHDGRVGSTICDIIADYLEEFPDRFLLAVYDQTDGLQQARNRLFTLWQSRYANEKVIIKSYSIGCDADGTYFCIVYNSRIPDEAGVLTVVSKMIQSILDKPSA